MRRRLVDRARRRLADKRGGGVTAEPLSECAAVQVADSVEDVEATLGRLDHALRQLHEDFPRAGRVVELRFLAGLTTEETAGQLRLSAGTVKRDWTFARAWLAAAMRDDPSA
jgi:RNA polymerase sigma factor (TIGR02999 family)